MSGETEALPPVEESTQAGTVEATEVPEATPEGEAKPELTPEQKRIADLERELKKKDRVIDKRTRRYYELQAKIEGGLTQPPNQGKNRTTADDSETLSLTRAEFEAQVKAEAARLAPTLSRQALEVEQQTKVVQSLQKSVGGPERFVELTNELAEVFSPEKQLAVLAADDPAALLQYLTDPDNAEEAEEIGRLDALSAGRRLAKIEAKLSQPKPTPQVSKAPAPLEPIKARGAASGMPDPKNTREWMAWRNDQERKGLA